MKDVWKRLISFISKITMKDVIYSLIILIMFIFLSMSIDRCTSVKREYKNNIEALKDTIHYLQDKNGNLVATKRAFEADIKTLKILNEDLYNEVADLKAKAKMNSAVNFTGFIELEKHDTTYIVQHDTIYKGFYKEFNFSNDYRVLEGNVQYANDILKVDMTKDQVFFDYTVALDEKNNIYIKSSNPYVKYSSMTGYQIPHSREKKWYLGPAISGGYDPIANKASVNVGVAFGYGLFRF